MTDDEFDKITLHKGDKIELHRYFKTEREEVENVNFTYREINGYKPQQIAKYIPYDKRRNH